MNKLAYFTQDKSIYLRSSSQKIESKKLKAHEMLKQAIASKNRVEKSNEKLHWIEKTNIEKGM